MTSFTDIVEAEKGTPARRTRSEASLKCATMLRRTQAGSKLGYIAQVPPHTYALIRTRKRII
jgi:hypothetical protein